MKLRNTWLLLAAGCALPLNWTVRPGEPAPDLLLQNHTGAEVRLSAYRNKKQVAVLALAPGAVLSPAVLEDSLRRITALDAALLLASGPPSTSLIDTNGVVRRVRPGQTLTGPELAAFVTAWRRGREVFNASCARCHGEEGDNNICLDVKPLVGLGKHLSEAQIRERLRPGEINDRDLIIRGQIYSRTDIDAVIAYVSGL
jgi:hypothetical protein